MTRTSAHHDTFEVRTLAQSGDGVIENLRFRVTWSKKTGAFMAHTVGRSLTASAINESSKGGPGGFENYGRFLDLFAQALRERGGEASVEADYAFMLDYPAPRGYNRWTGPAST